MGVKIGTSGWVYEHWKEIFYQNIPAAQWLDFYAEHFSTVEINSTFYHLPTEKSVKNWAKTTPKDFLFSVKVSRYITHVKRLKDPEESLGLFFNHIALLKDKLGPILFLLPPQFKANHERLAQLIYQLPEGYRYVFEFRNASWLSDETYDLLRKHNIALCISDLKGKLTPIEITASFVYIRLHGPAQAYAGSYSSAKLKQWAKRIEEWQAQKKDVYLYFDNDEKGYAIKDATRLKKLLSI